MLPERNKSIFVAGASGVIGRRLCRLLLEDGWQVTGTTRSSNKAAALRAIGVAPVIVDVFDETALHQAIMKAHPAIVIHQLTDLPPALDPARMAEARVRNARIRDIGTRNLLAAAIAAGAKRMIAQSIAFAYAPGPLPYHEDSPLNVDAVAVASLEQQVVQATCGHHPALRQVLWARDGLRRSTEWRASSCGCGCRCSPTGAHTRDKRYLQYCRRRWHCF